jgi:hypothetical protein
MIVIAARRHRAAAIRRRHVHHRHHLEAHARGPGLEHVLVHDIVELLVIAAVAAVVLSALCGHSGRIVSCPATVPSI